MHSTDGGTWSEPTAIIRGGDAGNFYPSLAQTKDGVFHLAWFRIDQKSHKFSVWYAIRRTERTGASRRPLRLEMKATTGFPPSSPPKTAASGLPGLPGKRATKTCLWRNRKTVARVGGASASDPPSVSDDLPNIEQKPDGTFIVVWTNHRPRQSRLLVQVRTSITPRPRMDRNGATRWPLRKMTTPTRFPKSMRTWIRVNTSWLGARRPALGNCPGQPCRPSPNACSAASPEVTRPASCR